jgi:hypothetical protein
VPQLHSRQRKQKRGNRRCFQLKRQGKQQTSTVAVTLVPGKIEPQ